jgi:hypothetical protein
VTPALLVAEPASLGTSVLLLAVPLRLMVEEAPDDTGLPPTLPVAVLVQPFNAGRLLAAVEPLLGPVDPP